MTIADRGHGDIGIPNDLVTTVAMVMYMMMKRLLILVLDRMKTVKVAMIMMANLETMMVKMMKTTL